MSSSNTKIVNNPINDIWHQYNTNEIVRTRLRHILVNETSIDDLMIKYAELCEFMTHVAFAIQQQCPGVKISYAPDKYLLTDTY